MDNSFSSSYGGEFFDDRLDSDQFFFHSPINHQLAQYPTSLAPPQQTSSYTDPDIQAPPAHSTSTSTKLITAVTESDCTALNLIEPVQNQATSIIHPQARKICEIANTTVSKPSWNFTDSPPLRSHADNIFPPPPSPPPQESIFDRLFNTTANLNQPPLRLNPSFHHVSSHLTGALTTYQTDYFGKPLNLPLNTSTSIPSPTNSPQHLAHPINTPTTFPEIPLSLEQSEVTQIEQFTKVASTLPSFPPPPHPQLSHTQQPPLDILKQARIEAFHQSKALVTMGFTPSSEWIFPTYIPLDLIKNSTRIAIYQHKVTIDGQTFYIFNHSPRHTISQLDPTDTASGGKMQSTILSLLKQSNMRQYPNNSFPFSGPELVSTHTTTMSDAIEANRGDERRDFDSEHDDYFDIPLVPLWFPPSCPFNSFLPSTHVKLPTNIDDMCEKRHLQPMASTTIPGLVQVKSPLPSSYHPTNSISAISTFAEDEKEVMQDNKNRLVHLNTTSFFSNSPVLTTTTRPTLSSTPHHSASTILGFQSLQSTSSSKSKHSQFGNHQINKQLNPYGQIERKKRMEQPYKMSDNSPDLYAYISLPPAASKDTVPLLYRIGQIASSPQNDLDHSSGTNSSIAPPHDVFTATTTSSLLSVSSNSSSLKMEHTKNNLSSIILSRSNALVYTPLHTVEAKETIEKRNKSGYYTQSTKGVAQPIRTSFNSPSSVVISPHRSPESNQPILSRKVSNPPDAPRISSRTAANTFIDKAPIDLAPVTDQIDTIRHPLCFPSGASKTPPQNFTHKFPTTTSHFEHHVPHQSTITGQKQSPDQNILEPNHNVHSSPRTDKLNDMPFLSDQNNQIEQFDEHNSTSNYSFSIGATISTIELSHLLYPELSAHGVPLPPQNGQINSNNHFINSPPSLYISSNQPHHYHSRGVFYGPHQQQHQYKQHKIPFSTIHDQSSLYHQPTRATHFHHQQHILRNISLTSRHDTTNLYHSPSDLLEMTPHPFHTNASLKYEPVDMNSNGSTYSPPHHTKLSQNSPSPYISQLPGQTQQDQHLHQEIRYTIAQFDADNDSSAQNSFTRCKNSPYYSTATTFAQNHLPDVCTSSTMAVAEFAHYHWTQFCKDFKTLRTFVHSTIRSMQGREDSPIVNNSSQNSHNNREISQNRNSPGSFPQLPLPLHTTYHLTTDSSHYVFNGTDQLYCGEGNIDFVHINKSLPSSHIMVTNASFDGSESIRSEVVSIIHSDTSFQNDHTLHHSLLHSGSQRTPPIQKFIKESDINTSKSSLDTPSAEPALHVGHISTSSSQVITIIPIIPIIPTQSALPHLPDTHSVDSHSVQIESSTLQDQITLTAPSDHIQDNLSHQSLLSQHTQLSLQVSTSLLPESDLSTDQFSQSSNQHITTLPTLTNPLDDDKSPLKHRFTLGKTKFQERKPRGGGKPQSHVYNNRSTGHIDQLQHPSHMMLGYQHNDDYANFYNNSMSNTSNSSISYPDSTHSTFSSGLQTKNRLRHRRQSSRQLLHSQGKLGFFHDDINLHHIRQQSIQYQQQLHQQQQRVSNQNFSTPSCLASSSHLSSQSSDQHSEPLYRQPESTKQSSEQSIVTTSITNQVMAKRHPVKIDLQLLLKNHKANEAKKAETANANANANQFSSIQISPTLSPLFSPSVHNSSVIVSPTVTELRLYNDDSFNNLHTLDTFNTYPALSSISLAHSERSLASAQLSTALLSLPLSTSYQTHISLNTASNPATTTSLLQFPQFDSVLFLGLDVLIFIACVLLTIANVREIKTEIKAGISSSGQSDEKARQNEKTKDTPPLASPNAHVIQQLSPILSVINKTHDAVDTPYNQPQHQRMFESPAIKTQKINETGFGGVDSYAYIGHQQSSHALAATPYGGFKNEPLYLQHPIDRDLDFDHFDHFPSQFCPPGLPLRFSNPTQRISSCQRTMIDHQHNTFDDHYTSLSTHTDGAMSTTINNRIKPFASINFPQYSNQLHSNTNLNRSNDLHSSQHPHHSIFSSSFCSTSSTLWSNNISVSASLVMYHVPPLLPSVIQRQDQPQLQSAHHDQPNIPSIELRDQAQQEQHQHFQHLSSLIGLVPGSPQPPIQSTHETQNKIKLPSLDTTGGHSSLLFSCRAENPISVQKRLFHPDLYPLESNQSSKTLQCYQNPSDLSQFANSPYKGAFSPNHLDRGKPANRVVSSSILDPIQQISPSSHAVHSTAYTPTETVQTVAIPTTISSRSPLPITEKSSQSLQPSPNHIPSPTLQSFTFRQPTPFLHASPNDKPPSPIISPHSAVVENVDNLQHAHSTPLSCHFQPHPFRVATPAAKRTASATNPSPDTRCGQTDTPSSPYSPHTSSVNIHPYSGHIFDFALSEASESEEKSIPSKAPTPPTATTALKSFPTRPHHLAQLHDNNIVDDDSIPMCEPLHHFNHLNTPVATTIALVSDDEFDWDRLTRENTMLNTIYVDTNTNTQSTSVSTSTGNCNHNDDSTGAGSGHDQSVNDTTPNRPFQSKSIPNSIKKSHLVNQETSLRDQKQRDIVIDTISTQLLTSPQTASGKSHHSSTPDPNIMINVKNNNPHDPQTALTFPSDSISAAPVTTIASSLNDEHSNHNVHNNVNMVEGAITKTATVGDKSNKKVHFASFVMIVTPLVNKD